MNFFTKAFSSSANKEQPQQQVAQPVQENTNSENSVKNPLDVYKKLYEDANKNSDIEAPSFKLDSKILNEVASSMDFTKGIQEDLITQALSGDAKALLEVIKSVGRNAYSASLEHTTALTEAYLAKRQDYEKKRLDEGIRTRLTEEALSSTPNYSHPVLKAELNRIASMIAKQNPDASPAAIAKQAQEHLLTLASALNGEIKEQPQEQKEMDWTKYLTV